MTDAEYLRRTSISAGVGTAGRIGKLLGETSKRSPPPHFWLFVDTDKYTLPQASLSLKALTHILIDTSHQDAKTMTIFDLAEIRLAYLIAT
jgi:hypothetical protein